MGRCPGVSSTVGMDQPLLCCSFPLSPPGPLQSPSHAVCPQPAHGQPGAAPGAFLCSALAWAKCSGESLGKEPAAPRPWPEASALPQQCPWPVPAAAPALPPPALCPAPRALRPYSNTRASRAAGQGHGSSTANTKGCCCCCWAQLLCQHRSAPSSAHRHCCCSSREKKKSEISGENFPGRSLFVDLAAPRAPLIIERFWGHR